MATIESLPVAEFCGQPWIPAGSVGSQTILEVFAGVRALRFNMFRSQIDSVDDLVALATRAHAVADWHAEIYADAAALAPYVDRLTRMAAPLSIDHLGMTQAGLPALLDLVSGASK